MSEMTTTAEVDNNSGKMSQPKYCRICGDDNVGLGYPFLSHYLEESKHFRFFIHHLFYLGLSEEKLNQINHKLFIFDDEEVTEFDKGLWNLFGKQ